MRKDQEQACTSFLKLLQRTMDAQIALRDKKLVKICNLTVDNIEYTREVDIMDAYGYEIISEAQKDQLLKALEFRGSSDRPRLKEDYLILLCHKAQALVWEMQAKDAREQHLKEQVSLCAELRRKGCSPIHCGCCGDVIGETSSTGVSLRYDSWEECEQGHVCRSCRQSCSGQAYCRRAREESEE